MANENMASASYDSVASEYYDSTRHPTCANFSELSKTFIESRIPRYIAINQKILEVGCGRSTAAPILETLNISVAQLTLLDQSKRMLEYSDKWRSRGAQFLMRDVRATALPEDTFQMIVSSLGDPYDDAAFWKEVSRLLLRNGVCLFTTPAWEWASCFRSASERDVAEFLLQGGRVVRVPSIVRPPREQISLIEENGLRVVEQSILTLKDLHGPISNKLLISRDLNFPVVRGFVITK